MDFFIVRLPGVVSFSIINVENFIKFVTFAPTKLKWK